MDIKDPAALPVKSVKPGVKTSEFWLTVATIVGSLTASLAGALPPQYAAIVSAISAGLYSYARGQAKS